MCFNSLQTGKRIQSGDIVGAEIAVDGFNSLQTGKRIQSRRAKATQQQHSFVSIPFKRESVSKATGFLLATLFYFRFNSLQTGKRIQSSYGAIHAIRETPCFNSLQTGKRIQRKGDKSLKKQKLYRFNSLQTGKRIQRDPILIPVGPWLRTPKTKRELRGAIFERNFSPKIPQTHVCIDPNAIFS